MSKKYIFDLDNTLVFTDKLNTKAYNFALNKVGLACITNVKRITKDTVREKFPQISNISINKIVKIKQKYFRKHIAIATLNENVVKELFVKDARDCFLWSSAEKRRVKFMLKHYCLKKYFYKIIFSDKKDISRDIVRITQLANCCNEDLTFYENDEKIIEELKTYNCTVNQ